jgi:hypothetical protein
MFLHHCGRKNTMKKSLKLAAIQHQKIRVESTQLADPRLRITALLYDAVEIINLLCLY